VDAKQKSTADIWDTTNALRADTLLYLPKKEATVLEWAVRGCVLWLTEHLPMPAVAYRGSDTKGHLQAAMRDLQATARFLRYAYRHSVEVMDSSSKEEELGRWAGDLATEVNALAEAIAGRLNPNVRKPHG
jgi:hypothetical protein